ncbi:hypothetical protein GQ53DRAFT_743141 [Thozetella sp. PMI_491]|nr:hypothetical protein GQ53DRAFT_743141 [Thozetella sp. PMI_491]
MAASNFHQHGVEPGLQSDKEVHSYSDLIVSDHRYDAPPPPPSTYPSEYKYEPAAQSVLNPTVKSLGRRDGRRVWVLPAAAVLLAIITGIIGGIVGWQVTASKSSCAASATAATCSNSTSSGNSTTSPSDSRSGSTAGAAKTIRANSALAVTGWRYGSTDFSLRLFYQGGDGVVRYSAYDTIFATWSPPKALDLAARSNTPLAATTIWWEPKLGSNSFTSPQLQFFYFGSGNKLMGLNWGTVSPSTGSPDSINADSYSIGSTNRMAALWPSIILQDDSSSVNEVFFNNVSQYESPADLSIAGSASAPLLVLPLTTTHQGSELRLLYRHTDGQLHIFDRTENGTVASSTGTTGLVLPSDAPLAGFATARGDGTTKVNSVVLWQDTSSSTNGGVYYTTNTNDQGWKEPTTDKVFADADKPTQMACLTAGLTGGDTPYGAAVPLVGNTDMSRCYFQAGGAVKEVSYDGSSWHEVGFVYMP